jgi:hypothetical protein
MTRVSDLLQRSAKGPCVLGAVGVVLLFVVACVRPYRVESDVAYQAKAAQQFVQGQSPRLNTLVLVDSKDLARDRSSWISWWPPAISAAFTVLLGMGLPVGVAGRVLAFFAMLAGVIGWIRVAVLLIRRSSWRLVAILIILLYPITSRLPVVLQEGDFASFAVQPWFYYWALCFATDSTRLGQQELRRNFWMGSLLLGLVYWLKYTAIFGAAVVLVTMVVILLLSPSFASKRAMWLTILVGLALFCLPVVGLKLLNDAYGRWNVELTGVRVTRLHRGPGLGAIKAIVEGAGPALFGAGDGLSRIGRALDSFVAWNWNLYLAVPGFILLLAAGYLSWRLAPRPVALLGTLSVIVPLGGLGACIGLMGFPYPSEIERHILPYWIFLEILVIWLLSEGSESKAGTALSLRQDWSIRSCRWVCWAVFIYLLAASSFSVYRFVRYDIWRWRGMSYSMTSNRLFVPTWSSIGVQPIRQLLDQLSLGPRDIVVPAAPWLGMEAWLEIHERLLPLSNFSAPLRRSHGTDLEYFSDQPLRSTQPLRVVLLVSNLYQREDYIQSVARIKNRFPQAAEWRLLQGGRGTEDELSVWIAELKPD